MEVYRTGAVGPREKAVERSGREGTVSFNRAHGVTRMGRNA